MPRVDDRQHVKAGLVAMALFGALLVSCEGDTSGRTPSSRIPSGDPSPTASSPTASEPPTPPTPEPTRTRTPLPEQTPFDGPGYENPVFPHDAPDPAVLRAEGFVYVVTTQSEYPRGFLHAPLLRSRDLVHWRLVGDALPELPGWAADGADVWAPHLARIGERYVLYFSARDDVTGVMQLGVATSATPEGPFRPQGGRIMGLLRERIDPVTLRMPDGRQFLYWSQENTVQVAPLSDDGLRIEGRPTTVLNPIGQEGDGVQSVVEGAWPVVRDGRVYLFVSGDRCCGPQARYAVSVARANDPEGPFQRFPGNPVLARNDRFFAPGHCSVLEGRDGRMWMLYHAMPVGQEGEARILMIDEITWEGDWPVVNGGAGPSYVRRPLPAV